MALLNVRTYLLIAFILLGIFLGIHYFKLTHNSISVVNSQPSHPMAIKSDTPTLHPEAGKLPAPIHYQNKVAVLTYHNIDEKESAYTISPQAFHQHMQALKDNGYNVISIEDFILFLQGKKDVPPNAVVITFDDGYKSVYTYAYPELKSQGFTATTFLIVHYENVYNPTLPFLSWDQVKEMKKDGFSFYSHTYDLHEAKLGDKGKQVYPLFNRIMVKNRLETDKEYEKRVGSDLSQAEKLLKAQLGNQLSLLCFPHGEYNQKSIDIAKNVGIHYFFSGTEGINTKGISIIKRINVGSPYVTAESLIKKLNYFENH